MPARFLKKPRACEAAADWSCAETSYRASIAARPAAEAWANLGVVYARQEKYAPAIDAYSAALRLNSSLHEIRLNIGIAHYKAGDRSSAIRELRAYLSHAPGSRQARQLLATALLESDQYAEAAKLFESLLPSEDIALRLGLASAYIRLHRDTDARPILEQLARVETAPALLVVGQSQLAANDFDAAEKALGRAARLDPSLPGVHFTLGASRWKQRDIVGALTNWREELRVDPSNFEAAFALGAVLAEERVENATASAEAVQLLESAVARRPQHGAALFHLGKLAWKLNRPGAQALLERAVRAAPENRQAHYLLAQIYKASHRPQDAARHLAIVQRLAAREMQRDIDVVEEAK